MLSQLLHHLLRAVAKKEHRTKTASRKRLLKRNFLKLFMHSVYIGGPGVGI